MAQIEIEVVDVCHCNRVPVSRENCYVG